MKQFNWMKKAAAAVMALGLMTTSVAALAAEDVNLEAPKAGVVTIDGKLDEWDLSRTIKVNKEEQITDQIEHWDGEADCSVDVYAMWDEENLYLGATIKDDTPFVYREGFPLDELDSIILFLSTNPDADPARTAYEATDWRLVMSAEDYYGDWFLFVDRDRVADPQGYETMGEYGDELASDTFENFEAAFQRVDGGATYEIRIPLSNLANDQIAQLAPQAGMTLGFDFSILDVDLPCPGIHSLRMQASSNQTGRDRKPEMHDVDNNPSLWGTLTLVAE